MIRKSHVRKMVGVVGREADEGKQPRTENSGVLDVP